MEPTKNNYNQKSKINTTSWRKNNPEKYKTLSQKHAIEYYYRNREVILQKQKAKYYEKTRE